MVELKFSFATASEAQTFLAGVVGVDASTKAEAKVAVQEQKSAAEYLSPKGMAAADAMASPPPPPAVKQPVKPAATVQQAAAARPMTPVEKARAEAARIKEQANKEAAAKSLAVPASAPQTPTAAKPSLKMPQKAAPVKFGLKKLKTVCDFPVCWPASFIETEIESPEDFAEWSTAREEAIAAAAAISPSAVQALSDVALAKKGIVAMAMKASTDNITDVKQWLDSVKELLGVKVFRDATDEQVLQMADIFLLSIDGFEQFFQ